MLPFTGVVKIIISFYISHVSNFCILLLYVMQIFSSDTKIDDIK